jgi:hypothetical protein
MQATVRPEPSAAADGHFTPAPPLLPLSLNPLYRRLVPPERHHPRNSQQTTGERLSCRDATQSASLVATPPLPPQAATLPIAISADTPTTLTPRATPVNRRAPLPPLPE